jgi:hypothetical protein
MFKDLLNPTNFNVMVSKLSDVLVGGVSGLFGQYILKLHAAASNLELLRVLDTMLKDLA